MLKFRATKKEMLMIAKIADRAEKLGIGYDRMTMVMDVEVCHSNGSPLDIPALLEASDADFAHDINGIRRHINRETGKLEGCFFPRCGLVEVDDEQNELTNGKERKV